VNVGYRLSAFGFLASDKPRVSGNYGFKDQWLALEWIKANIEAFGGLKYTRYLCLKMLTIYSGDPTDIQLTGLSAGELKHCVSSM